MSAAVPSVVMFDDAVEADATVLGGKAASLVAMTRLGVPVPPGFVVPIAVANDPPALLAALHSGLDRLEARTGDRLGAGLTVSVRSGAAVSMPGMMDTILNVGMGERASDPLSLDCRRRFLQSWGSQVSGVDRARFDEIAEEAGNAREVVTRFEALVTDVPGDPREAVMRAAEAVVASWDGARARDYRHTAGVGGAGTAVVVQAMVFGNRNEQSATGVAFTRDPTTGEKRLVGEFLSGAQGEDVVSGFATPDPLTGNADSFERRFVLAHRELGEVARTLEGHYADAQELEFTVDGGRLWLLQSRTAKRSTRAALRMAVDMAEEGLITRADAVKRTDPAGALARLVDRLAPGQSASVVAAGLPASPGAVAGRVVTTSVAAREAEGPVILVRPETDPEDVSGMAAAAGVLTARGGMTSHAAVVARSLGRPCIAGAGAVEVSGTGFTVAGTRYGPDDWITVDGTSGRAYAGRLETVPTEPEPELSTLLGWANQAD